MQIPCAHRSLRGRRMAANWVGLSSRGSYQRTYADPSRLSHFFPLVIFLATISRCMQMSRTTAADRVCMHLQRVFPVPPLCKPHSLHLCKPRDQRNDVARIPSRGIISSRETTPIMLVHDSARLRHRFYFWPAATAIAKLPYIINVRYFPSFSEIILQQCLTVSYPHIHNLGPFAVLCIFATLETRISFRASQNRPTELTVCLIFFKHWIYILSSEIFFRMVRVPRRITSGGEDAWIVEASWKDWGHRRECYEQANINMFV